MPPHSGSVVEPVTPRLHDPSDAPGILIQRYASRRATPVFAVGLEDDDGLLVTSALRESVDPGQVVGSVEGAARRVLAAVAEGDVVSDQCRNGMLSGRLLHGLGDVLLDLLGSATVEPHRLRRVDHVADQESVFEVMVLGQVGDLGECPIDTPKACADSNSVLPPGSYQRTGKRYPKSQAIERPKRGRGAQNALNGAPERGLWLGSAPPT
jgi:hypothetical protein